MFVEQTPPVFVMPVPVIWEESPSAFSGVDDKL